MMNKTWLDQLREDPSPFIQGRFGLEKENLRVKANGRLDQRDHPITKNDPFYTSIVKDFAESQVEFVTKPMKTPGAALDDLKHLQDYFLNTFDARLWPYSMPCHIDPEEDIRIAEFDDSTEGRAAREYREILAQRHGKKMQLISGVHYSFSYSDALVAIYQKHHMPDAVSTKQVKNQLYFHVARNILRYKWLLIYLYGASPFVDASYKEDVTRELKCIEHCCPYCADAHTYYDDYGISLRMSHYGYHTKLQEEMCVSYNQLDEYIEHIRIGIDQGILQKESEYYAPLRFKNSNSIKGSMLEALETEGVEYLELRLFDLNPYETYGLTEEQMYVTHLVLIYAIIKPSPCISKDEMTQIDASGQLVSLFGRKEGQEVFYRGGYHAIPTLGGGILEDLGVIASLLDKNDHDGPYLRAVKSAGAVLANPSLLISSKLTRELLADGLSYIGQGIRHSIYGKKEVRL
jgi:glutamate--cysteine ligase